MAVVHGTNIDFKVPSLDLRFSDRKDLIDTISGEDLITFTRNSIGTYVDANGLIKTTTTNEARFDHDPVTGESLGLLVEEARTNLQTRSNAPYTTGGVNVTLTPNHLAPDGTATAVLYTENTATSQHYHQVNIFPSPAFSAGTYTFSVFVKSNGSNRVSIKGPATETVTFDLSTVSVIAASGSTCSIINAGDGWFRCSVTRSVASSITQYQYYAGLNSDTGSGFESYAGDGISGAYFWGWQIEAGTFPTSYIPTPATFTSRSTTATYYDASGVIQTAAIDVARDDAYFPDENGVFKPAGLLLEAAGTNLLTYSEDLTDASWVKGSSSVTGNAATAPDGTLIADKLVENTGTTSHVVSKLTTTTAGLHTFSVYLKKAERSFAMLYDLTNGVGAYFDLNTGQISTGGSAIPAAPTYSSQNVGNGWWRCSITSTATAAANTYRVYLASSSTIYSYTGDGTSGIYIWGAQLEAGSFPTSYIPTTSSTVTRAADVSSSATVTRAADVAQITGSNFSSWYNQSEGTVFGEHSSFSFGNPSSLPTLANFTNGTLNEYIRLNSAPSYKLRSFIVDNGVIQTQITTGGASSNSTIIKSAVGIQENNVAIVVGGASPYIATSCTVPSPTSLQIGNWVSQLNTFLNGHISRLTYYPTRLSNAILQNLTK